MTELVSFLKSTAKEERVDREAILADLDALADGAENGRDHLPYEAAIEFFSDDRVREMYEPHVNDCAYCKEMLDTLNPSDQLLGVLHGVVAKKKVAKKKVKKKKAKKKAKKRK